MSKFKLLLSIFFINISSLYAGNTMTCTATDPYSIVKDYSILIGNEKDDLWYICHDKKGDSYRMAFGGIGPGLEITYMNGFKVKCTGQLEGIYEGISASVSCIVGLECGLLFGQPTGDTDSVSKVCMLVGAKFLSIGGGLMYSRLDIWRDKN